MKKGFTLIELLIVVAIIAILAAIAVPNFLEAQVRSKVSRVKADIRSLATAVECYCIDNNKYPLSTHPLYGDPVGGPSGIFRYGPPGSITTPIAYISNAKIIDPFAVDAQSGGLPMDEVVFTWNNFTDINTSWFYITPARINYYLGFYGKWRIGSIGPDRNWYNNPARIFDNRNTIVYDPTNGTVSVGNIWRSQNYGEVTRSPYLDSEL